MSLTVCLAANTIGYPEGGGHFWVCLNWALGFQALGCRVIWLERVSAKWTPEKIRHHATRMRGWLAPYGLADMLALCAPEEVNLPDLGTLTLEDSTQADLLFNLHYLLKAGVVSQFRRSALLDIDPGLLQTYLVQGTLEIAPHDRYFTIGPNVGTTCPDAGLAWKHVLPCVALDQWPVGVSPPDSRFTTISHWWTDEWMVEADGSYYKNDKQTGFLAFENLPLHTSQPLELALFADAEECRELREKGWRVIHSQAVSSSPERYQGYIQQSLGEFGWAKPGYKRLQSGWISDRTPCYLASGKPVVLQDTGPLDFLPPDAGFFRFKTVEEAARKLDLVAAHYDKYSRLARSLPEEYFSARIMADEFCKRRFENENGR